MHLTYLFLNFASAIRLTGRYLVFTSLKMSDYPEKDRLFLLRLTEVILSNLGKENFDVSELASQSGMTRYQLLHRLQSITGKNITQFIRETRLHKALELIKQEDLTISQVSYMTGFCSPTYFNTCFSEYFGYPPGAVRKQDIADTRALTESGIAPVLVKHVNKKKRVALASLISLAGILILISGNLLLPGDNLSGTMFSNNRKDYKTKDITGMHGDMAYSVAEVLRTDISTEEKERIELLPTINLDAYDFYQRGREEASKLGKYDYNPEIIRKAEEYFSLALSYDSSFIQVYNGLAELLWKRWYLDYNPSSNFNAENCLDSILLLANTGLSYDPGNEHGYLFRGLYYSVKGTPAQAIKEYDEAIKLNPDLAQAYFMKGGLLEELDIVSSLENFLKASSLSHGSDLVSALTRIAYLLYNSGYPEMGEKFLREADFLECDSAVYNYKSSRIVAETTGNYLHAAEVTCRRVKRDPENVILYRDMGYFYCLSARYKEAMESYNEYLTRFRQGNRSSPFLNRFTCLGFVFKQMSVPDKSKYYFDLQAEACLRRLNSILPSERIYWAYPLAAVYSSKGDTRKALDYLKLFSLNTSYTLTWLSLIRNDPQLDNLRSDPEFEIIKSDIERKYLSEHEKVGQWIEARKRE